MALLAVTIFSTALAATTSVMAWRLARRETRRSDARVAALASAIHGREGRVNAEPSAAMANFPSEYPAAATAAGPSLGLAARGSSTALSAAVVIVAGAAAVAGLLTLAAARRGNAAPDGGIAHSKMSGATATSGRSSAATAVTAPLELIALSHERGKDSLIVRGEIRNPLKGTACEMPAVVVLAFDERGIFLGSSESDARGESLPPGGRATFSVSVPARAPMPARYKISFRSEGRIVPHVDRRVPGVAPGGAEATSKAPRQAGSALPVQP